MGKKSRKFLTSSLPPPIRQTLPWNGRIWEVIGWTKERYLVLKPVGLTAEAAKEAEKFNKKAHDKDRGAG